MSSGDINPPQRREFSLISRRRWVADVSGRAVYYPSGPRRSGYAVPDEGRERALRAADQRYEEISDRFKPIIPLLSLLFLGAFWYFMSSHPFLAFAVFPAAFVVLVLIDQLNQRMSIAPCLIGLARVPAAEQALIRSPRLVICAVIAIICGISLVSHIYDQRLVAADGESVGFYPDISRDLLMALLCGMFPCLPILAWGRFAANANRGKIALGCLVFAGLGLWFGTAAVRHFRDARPAIVVSRDDLSCQWRLRWADIAGLRLQEGSRSAKYVQVETTSDRLKSSAHDRSIRRCEIDGLNADYATIYDAMRTRWLAAVSRPAVALPDVN